MRKGRSWGYPKRAFPLVDAKAHKGRNLGRFGQGVVNVVRPYEASQIVDIGERGASFVRIGGELVELFHEGGTCQGEKEG